MVDTSSEHLPNELADRRIRRSGLNFARHEGQDGIRKNLGTTAGNPAYDVSFRDDARHPAVCHGSSSFRGFTSRTWRSTSLQSSAGDCSKTGACATTSHPCSARPSSRSRPTLEHSTRHQDGSTSEPQRDGTRRPVQKVRKTEKGHLSLPAQKRPEKNPQQVKTTPTPLTIAFHGWPAATTFVPGKKTIVRPRKASRNSFILRGRQPAAPGGHREAPLLSPVPWPKTRSTKRMKPGHPAGPGKSRHAGIERNPL